MKAFKLKGIVLFFLMVALTTTDIQATETVQTFLNGIKHYKEEDFRAAISEFLKIVDAGVQNSKLFYNLGNAYLKGDDLGHAILWYERALKLSPDDPDLKFNHTYALSMIKDETGDLEPPIFRILFFWKYLLSVRTIQWAAVILNAIFWTIFIIQILRKKKISPFIVNLILVLSIIFSLTALYNFYEAAFIKKAIILPSKVSIRSGLNNDATELFVLHAGTKIRVEEELSNFVKIYFSDGKIGWVKKSAVGVI